MDINKKIANCRETALQILQPTRQQLDHGLELHRDSLVWDAYGFAPPGPYNLELESELVESGASANEARIRMESYRQDGFLRDQANYEDYKAVWEASGVTCIFQNSGAGNSVSEILERFGNFTFRADRYADFHERAAWPDDVEKTKQLGKHCLYLTTNAVPLFDSWINEAEPVLAVSTFFKLGCRMMHLTYNRRNLIGDGCAEPGDSGLSAFGRSVVKEMNRTGVIPDVAHSGLRTSFEAAEVSGKPVVASHSFCNSVNNEFQAFRGKTDEVIRQIVKSGGFVGICALPGFVAKSGDINALLDHIGHIAGNFGADHVAIGTDAGFTVGLPAPLPNDKKIKFRTSFDSYWPSSQKRFDVSDEMRASLAWTNWPLFTVGLVQRGHSDADIKKIIGGNVMRVARETLRGIE